MYLPSDEMEKEIRCEECNTWFIEDTHNSKTLIVIKAPSSAIKSIIHGCKVELVIGQTTEGNTKFIVTGVRIFDVLNSPFVLFNTQKSAENYFNLARFTKKRIANIVFFNEANKNIASCECLIDETSSAGPLQLPKKLGIPKEYSVINSLLDAFADQVINNGTLQSYSLEVHLLSFKNWVDILNISYFGPKNSKLIKLFDEKDGEHGIIQENLAFEVLHRIYPERKYHSAQVDNEEFTDIFVDTPSFYFIIESKSIKISEKIPKQSRRESKIKDHSKKAIGQIKGAVKSIICKKEIFDHEGKVINLNYDKKVHAMILVPEISFSSEVDHLLDEVKNIYDKFGAFVHIVDISGLANMINIAKNNHVDFERILDDRFNIVIENNTLNIRHIDSSLPFQ